MAQEVGDAPAGSLNGLRLANPAHASEILDPDPILDPIRKALATVETHSKRILQRWTSSHSNARLEGLNGLFQAARARARGYRNVTTFATMIYMIAVPLGDLFIHLKHRRTRICKVRRQLQGYSRGERQGQNARAKCQRSGDRKAP